MAKLCDYHQSLHEGEEGGLICLLKGSRISPYQRPEVVGSARLLSEVMGGDTMGAVGWEEYPRVQLTWGKRTPVDVLGFEREHSVNRFRYCIRLNISITSPTMVLFGGQWTPTCHISKGKW